MGYGEEGELGLGVGEGEVGLLSGARGDVVDVPGFGGFDGLEEIFEGGTKLEAPIFSGW